MQLNNIHYNRDFSGIGIVLSSYPAPSGKFIHYFTHLHGKLSVLKKIKSSKSSLVSAGSLFSIEDIEVKKHKDIFILKHSKKILDFNPKNSILIFYIISLFSEIIERDITENDPIIFNNFILLLTLLDQNESQYSLSIFFMILLIKNSGWVNQEIFEDNDKSVLRLLSRIKDINKCIGISIPKNIFSDVFTYLVNEYMNERDEKIKCYSLLKKELNRL